jgi:hypothetical protein
MKIKVFILTFFSIGRIVYIDDSPALSGLGSLYGCLFFLQEEQIDETITTYGVWSIN